MRLSHELVYEAGADAVFAMLADPAFRERVCEAQQVVSCEVRLTPTDAGFELVSRQVQNTAGLPAIARKITGETTEAVVTESWRDRRSGTVEITAPGKPTSASGTVSLTERGGRTTELVELDVKVKVPLVGGKLEALMADTIKQGLLVEQTVGAAWLAQADTSEDVT